MTISDIQQDGADTHTAVSDVPCDIPNAEVIIPGAHLIVSNVHHNHNKLKSREGQTQTVSITYTLSPSGHLPLLRLTPGQRFYLRLNPLLNTCIQRTWRFTTFGIEKSAGNHFRYSSQCPEYPDHGF